MAHEPEPLPCRLDKYLRDAIGASRSEAAALVASWRVVVVTPCGDRTALDVGELVFADDVVRVDGAAVVAMAGTIVYALNKPLGVVSTTNDPFGRPCLTPWLERIGPRAFAVGRLDAETSGLLLATDDGDLGHMLLRPHHHVDKTYHLQVVGPVADDDPRLVPLRDGVVLHDGPARARALGVVASGPHVSVVALAIDEGRKHQVRHMARAVGFDLLALERVSIGPIVLGNQPVGTLRRLDDHEYEALWQACGGRELVVAAQLRALRGRVATAREAGRPDVRLEHWLAAHDAAPRP